MPRVKILTDSTADLPPDVVERLGITVLPMKVHIGQKTYRDGIDVTAKDFFAKAEHATAPPATTPQVGVAMSFCEPRSCIGRLSS